MKNAKPKPSAVLERLLGIATPTAYEPASIKLAPELGTARRPVKLSSEEGEAHLSMVRAALDTKVEARRETS